MYDMIIVGGGIAGLCAALEAPRDARIVVIDKGEAGAGSSPLAQGGMAAAVGPEDSPELHAADTIAAGAGICDEQVVADICNEGPAATQWLIEHGCDFDRNDDGSIHMAREGGQSVARSVHWRDATGAEIVRALRAAVRDRNIERVIATATNLFVHDGRCIGVFAGDGPDAPRFIGGAILMASGGAGALWGRTTNAPGAGGDGIALALMEGAQVADLEFMQFHPTALAVGSTQRVLLTEALRGEGATLVDASGERFVDELAPRHVVAKAILDAGKAYLDCRSLPDLEGHFPTIVAGARAHGLDPLTELLPVEPAAHYFIGGISSDAFGRTSIDGLFAAGECAATGMHGANRMAGNSLLESVVVGRRVGQAAAEQPSLPGGRIPWAAAVPGEVDPAIADLMWNHVGPVRDTEGLRAASRALAFIGDSPQRYLCEMIVRAAAARTESRGVHIRADFPEMQEGMATRSFETWNRRVGRLTQEKE